MSAPRILLCDLGGTLRRFRNPAQAYPTGTPGEWDLCPGVSLKLRGLAYRSGYLGVITNQPYIQTMQTSYAIVISDIFQVITQAIESREAAARIMQAMGDVLHPTSGWQICPHAPAMHCLCRKPSPYLLLKAMEWYWTTTQMPVSEMLYVGDEPCDAEAAARAGITFEWAAVYFAKAERAVP